MKKIVDRSTVESTAETDSASKGSKSQSLRFQKQTIRTLTGAELKLVGGGCIAGIALCASHTPIF
jgi:hypothetical protein